MPVYDYYRFLYPPRPEQVIPISQLKDLEAEGYWSQIKKNGTSNVIAISPDRQVITRDRRGREHRAWSPGRHTAAPFVDLPGGWYVFCAELLNNKVGGPAAPRDTNYIHDILVADSRSLYGLTFADRQNLLADLFQAHSLPVAAGAGHWIIDRHTWLARNRRRGLLRQFRGLEAPEDEGLVLKRPTTVLAPCVGPKANVSGQYKLLRER